MQCSTLALTFVFTLALGACRSSPVPSQPGAPSPVSVNELITKAQTDIAKLGTDLHEVLIRPNHDAVVKALKERSSGFVTNVQSYIEQMSKDLKVKGPEIGKMWDGFKMSLTKATEDISAQIPVAKDQISKLESKFLEGMGAIVKQSELVMETVRTDAEPIKQDISNLAKKAVEITVEATKELKTQIEEKLSKHES
ncbi:uncharacterized protein LOC124300504 [Neodiprion virginianus]|uniref:uncharacterized protein LOC124300504 n=1 Tax=Neodiprion virginianus TaxID=2961670 RepID=UPI001EE6B9B0|nr:uncharacterized protein LOC124300504 [Neodiprion virginianus]